MEPLPKITTAILLTLVCSVFILFILFFGFLHFGTQRSGLSLFKGLITRNLFPKLLLRFWGTTDYLKGFSRLCLLLSLRRKIICYILKCIQAYKSIGLQGWVFFVSDIMPNWHLGEVLSEMKYKWGAFMRDTREPLTEKYVHRPLKQKSVFTQCFWYPYILQRYDLQQQQQKDLSGFRLHWWSSQPCQIAQHCCMSTMCWVEMTKLPCLFC